MIKHVLLALCLVFAAASVFTATALPATAQSGDVAMAAQSGPVNINTADAETLSRVLKGVGKSRAEAIVRYRDEFGPFMTPEDLLEVQGIGKSTLERNRQRIVLE